MSDHTDIGQLKCKVEFFQFKSTLKKMNQHINTEKLWLKSCLNMKLTISLKACTKMAKSIELYHGSKAEITKGPNWPTFVMLPHDQWGKSVIVGKPPPLIRFKAFATHTGSLINLVFDQYFKKNLKEGTRPWYGRRLTILIWRRFYWNLLQNGWEFSPKQPKQE